MNTLDYIMRKYKLSLADRVEIPNVVRYDLAKLLRELDFKTGVEIGVERGGFSKILCIYNPQMKFWGIDPWESLDKCKSNPIERRTNNRSGQEKCDRYYEEAVNRLARFPNYKIIKEYSVDALKRFDDESLDFVYIDANHHYLAVTNDMTWWSKKVKKGGIVSGHDYYNTPNTIKVKEAINDYVGKNSIKPLIIWGLQDKQPNIKRDKWRSWMWIKQ